MKILQNYFAFNRMQNLFKRAEKNEIASIISGKKGKSTAKSTLGPLLTCSLLLTMYGCGKPTDNPNPTPANTTGCAITGDVDQALGSRIFEYDNKGLLVKMTGPNYYYGPFVRTITAAKAVDSYPTESVSGNGTHYNGNINITYNYSGGSGNIYDGNPEYLHESFVASNPPNNFKRDSLYQFNYDDAKKHLTSVFIAGSGSRDANGFTLFRYELSFAYDANDNVNQVKIIYDWSKKTVVVASFQATI
jgi:hypothetical protein